MKTRRKPRLMLLRSLPLSRHFSFLQLRFRLVDLPRVLCYQWFMEKIVGRALRKEREARGVSLADIAAETRIGPRFLQALEEEDFSVFPGTFYIHYYIKNYLRACGADETAFFNAHRDRLDAILRPGLEPPPGEYMQKMTYARFRRRRTLLRAVLALAAAGLAALLLLGRMAASAPSAPVPFPPFSSHLLPVQEEACPAPPPLEARLEFTAPCWLSLWRGSERVAERTFRAGETLGLSGYRLTFVVAAPTALRLWLNGREVTAYRRSAEAVKLVADPASLDRMLRRP